MPVPATGARAPEFVLLDETGAEVRSRDYAGKRVLLFFFQKAKSPGCAVTATEYRAALPRLRAAGIQVLGVSPDTWRRHAKFREAERLPFPVLADPGAVACQAFGIWREKLFYGRRYMGVARSSFLIGADGRIELALVDVHYAGQAAAVEAWLRGEALPTEPARGKVAATRPGNARPAARKK